MARPARSMNACVKSQEASVEIGDLPPHRVTAGDVVIIPPQVRQRISNIGTDDLVFLAICSPRFTGAAYVDLEA